MSTANFYAHLPALGQFLDLANPDNYGDAPADWYVLMTDVTGSTQAIAQGQYKEVNLLGASSIMAVLNAVYPLEVPFVFGGDGASLLVPPDALEAAREALLGIRAAALQSFGLDLRVGVVPVAVIIPHCPVRVAKVQITPTYSQASFMGGGLTYATELIKANPLYRLEVPGQVTDANLAGLECRWQDIPSPYGQTLSLIVAALPSGEQGQESVYREVLEAIRQIYGDALNYHPIATSALKLTFNLRRLWAEAKIRNPTRGWWSQVIYLLKTCLENGLGYGFMGLRLKVGAVNWGGYKQEVRAASDYQKIDDVLRMVMASHPHQTSQLVSYLDERSGQGHLAYGLHITDRALMTCLILDRRDRHFHLVDGADGGYALAAQQLKTKLRHRASHWKIYAQLAGYRQRFSAP